MVQGFTVVSLNGPYAAIIVKHMEKIQAMIDGGVFELEHGKATLGFKDGKLHNIHLDKLTYQRTSQKLIDALKPMQKTGVVP